jgi:integrase/recombinase XerD
MNLYDIQGRRLYLTADERRAFIAAAATASRPVRTLCTVLHDTGCRISEALALTSENIDLSGRAVMFESLKKRRRGIYRAVPVPPSLFDTLDMVHGIREAQKRGGGQSDRPLWPWARNTAWRHVKAVMADAGIPDGPHRSPKGLRHGYGVHAISSGVPLNMLSKWLGHATLEVMAIYANALGAEEQGIAARMWDQNLPYI